MIEVAALLLIGAAVLGFFVLRSRRPASGARTPRGRNAARGGPRSAGASTAKPVDPDAPPDVQLARIRRDGNFWGVMVRFAPGQGCAAVQAIRDTRYPLERVPNLPLRGCDSLQCRCGYTGLKERRRRDVLPPGGKDQREGSKVTWDVYKS